MKEKVKQFEHDVTMKQHYEDEAGKLYEFWNDPDLKRTKIK